MKKIRNLLSKPFKKESAQVQRTYKEAHLQIENGGRIGIVSNGIKAIPNLQSFFKNKLEFNPHEHLLDLEYIAGWGMKPSALKALEISNKYNIPYLALEDGFIRSIGLGVEGSAPFSICIDDIGIYYDATRPSRLEHILNSDGWESQSLQKKANLAITLIKQYDLSKYNHAPKVDQTFLKNIGKEKVLIVDQTLGDMSITLGMANKESFAKMFRKAKEDNPNADIYVKIHPDVISGKKKGNINSKMLKEAIILDLDCNPLSLLKHMDKVYVVTSQLGFEALLLNKEVHCFGMPFYAGWGLTIDQLKIDRRKKVRSFLEVFAAAYLLYPRYINPESGLSGDIFDVIRYLAENK